MKLLEQFKTLSVFPHGMIDIISHVCLIFDVLLFTTCTLLGRVYVTIAD